MYLIRYKINSFIPDSGGQGQGQGQGYGGNNDEDRDRDSRQRLSASALGAHNQTYAQENGSGGGGGGSGVVDSDPFNSRAAGLTRNWGENPEVHSFETSSVASSYRSQQSSIHPSGPSGPSGSGKQRGGDSRYDRRYDHVNSDAKAQ